MLRGHVAHLSGELSVSHYSLEDISEAQRTQSLDNLLKAYILASEPRAEDDIV